MRAKPSSAKPADVGSGTAKAATVSNEVGPPFWTTDFPSANIVALVAIIRTLDVWPGSIRFAPNGGPNQKFTVVPLAVRSADLGGVFRLGAPNTPPKTAAFE